MKKEVASGFLFNGQEGHKCFVYSGTQPRISNRSAFSTTKDWENDAVVKPLESYSNVVKGTWKHDLFHVKEEVARLMFSNKSILCDVTAVHFLHFLPDSSLWGKTW